MKNFTDLVFEPKTYAEGEQARLDFDNGYGVSVIIGGIAYGHGNSPYELAVFAGGDLCYDTPVTSNVIGHLTPSGVTELMKQVQELPNRK